MKEKNRYFEMLRGVAILMVIAIHTFGMASSTFKIEVRQLLNCAVPLFFVLSGYFLYQKQLSSKKEILSFWKRQILKVYLPVIIWSLPTFIKNILDNHSFVKEMLQLFSCGYHVFYFIAVIVQFYLLLPLLKKLEVKRGGWFLHF